MPLHILFIPLHKVAAAVAAVSVVAEAFQEAALAAAEEAAGNFFYTLLTKKYSKEVCLRGLLHQKMSLLLSYHI
jgi:hypothetical protein